MTSNGTSEHHITLFLSSPSTSSSCVSPSSPTSLHELKLASFFSLSFVYLRADRPQPFLLYLQKQLYSLAHFFSNTNPSTQLHPALPHRAEAPWPSGSLLELPPPCLLSPCLATTLTLSSSDTRLLTAKPMSQPYPVSSLHMHILSDSG